MDFIFFCFFFLCYKCYKCYITRKTETINIVPFYAVSDEKSEKYISQPAFFLHPNESS